MLQDDVTLDLFPELDIVVSDSLESVLYVDIIQEVGLTVEIKSEADIIVDLESMGIDVDNPLGIYSKIGRIITFNKIVKGYKTTFGKASLGINTNIITNGTAIIDPNNHNLMGIPIIFTKSVLGKKTTFGKTSLDLTSVINTNGVNSVSGVNFYGSDLYGVGPYGSISGYSSGAYGFGIYPGEAISRAIHFGSSVSGNVYAKTTSVAEISLGSHGVPATRTNHSIKVRARTTSGSTGAIYAALYEGSTNISGTLSTGPLSNTLTDYTLPIPDYLAETISSYSNLSIRFWGYDSAGNALTFEVAKIYLELPSVTGSVYYGSVSQNLTFGKSVSGSLSSKSTPVAEISLASHGIPSVRTNHSIKIRARTLTGSSGVIKAALYEGANNRSGILITNPLTNTLADYTLVILDANALSIIDYANLSIKFWGYDINNQALVFEIAKIYLELPVSNGNVTQYGIINRPFTFVKAVSGVGSGSGPTTHYGSVSSSLTFNKAVSGQRKTFGQVTAPFTFVKAVSGVISSKRTSTAEISLASHGTPSARTNHSIKVKARTTSGSTGVIKAELYEGSTVRSGSSPLTTGSLTNSLVTYTLSIANADAATITSYSNLSIKFWGFDSAGNALVFEVAEIYLELPTP